MSRRPTLFLGIETIARELDGSILLAHHAVDRGWNVVMGRRKLVLAAAERLGSGVLLQNAGHLGRHYPADRGTHPDLRLAQFHQEGLAYRSDEELLTRYPLDAVADMDVVFTFGQRQADLVAAELNLALRRETGDKVRAVGSPRFDLLDAQWRDVLLTSPTGYRFPSQPFVLINTAFAWGNPSRLYGGIFDDQPGPRAEPPEWWTDLPERRPGYKALFESYVEMLHDLGRQIAPMPIIVRPHPSEDHDNWRQLLADVPNAAVLFEASAVEWIRRCTVMIHTGCTTGIEGRFLSKPVLRYNPLDGQVDEPPLPNVISRRVETVEQILAAIADPHVTHPIDLSTDERGTLRPHLANADGPVACTRMLDAFEAFEPVATYDALETITGGRSRARAATAPLREVARTARRQLRRQPPTIASQKFPGLAASTVAARLRLIEAMAERPPAQVLQLERDLIGIAADQG